MARDTVQAKNIGAALGGGGFFAALGAMIGASCCVLPILLVQAGVSAALVTHLAVFTHLRPYLMALATLMVLAGFIAAFWGGRRPRAWLIIVLTLAAFLVAASHLLPDYERFVLDWIRGR